MATAHASGVNIGTLISRHWDQFATYDFLETPAIVPLQEFSAATRCSNLGEMLLNSEFTGGEGQ
jgi:hypothetical protein